jgi:TRAP-type C4-dicarboxylate transport system permease small subunit
MTCLQSIEKWFARGELVLVYAGVLATFAMMCLTSADALSRYLLKRPIIGAYEITEKYLMVAAIFLGLSYAFRGGVFIRVTFLVDRLPPLWQQLANHAAHLLSIAFCVIVLAATAQQAVRALSDDTTLSALPIPVGPAYWFVPLGFFALTALMLLDLPRVRSGHSLLFKQEAPPAA